MWLTPIVKALQSWTPGTERPATRRVRRPLPPPCRPAVEPLEERLVLTPDVSVDVTPGGTGRRSPPPITSTTVLGLMIAWFDVVRLGGEGLRAPGGGNPGPRQVANRGGLFAGGAAGTDALPLSVPGITPNGPLDLAPAFLADGGLNATPAQTDAFFQLYPSDLGLR